MTRTWPSPSTALPGTDGGIVVVENGQVLAELPLEIAGIISGKPLREVNTLLEDAKKAAHALGVGTDIDPFMTLSLHEPCPSSPPCA